MEILGPDSGRQGRRLATVPANADRPLQFLLESLAEPLTEVSGWPKRRISAAFSLSSQVGFDSNLLEDTAHAKIE